MPLKEVRCHSGELTNAPSDFISRVLSREIPQRWYAPGPARAAVAKHIMHTPFIKNNELNQARIYDVIERASTGPACR